MDSGLKSSLPPVKDQFSNRVNAHKTQEYPNRQRRGKTTLIQKEPPHKEIKHPFQLYTDNAFTYVDENPYLAEIKRNIYFACMSWIIFGSKQKVMQGNMRN